MKTRATAGVGFSLKGAFTLPEVMMAVALCALSLIMVFEGLGFCYKTMDGIRKNQRATQILLQTFELVRLYNWEQINTTGYMPGTIYANETNVWATASTDQKAFYSGTVTTAAAPFNASYSGDLILVTVHLNWTNGTIAHNRLMNTLVARQGIQNYDY